MLHQWPTDDVAAVCLRLQASTFNTGAWHARCAILYDLTGASIFLMRDHKRVGEQEVYSMMSRQLFYSFLYLTSVTTGIHRYPPVTLDSSDTNHEYMALT